MNENSAAVKDGSSSVGIIDFAQVMAGAIPFKDAGIANVTDTFRGQIMTRDSQLQTAILKDLEPKELANEVLAASLAQALGLPVPTAFVGITAADDHCSTRTRLPDGRGLMFASVDVGSPSVAQVVLVSTQHETIQKLRPIIDVLIKQTWLGSLYGFDAWVANIDRHVGNMLFAAGSGAWIIDHGRCFTGNAWTPSDLIPDKTYPNRLREWVTPFLSAADRTRLAGEASALSIRLSGVDVRAAGTRNNIIGLIGTLDFEALVAFLAERIPHIPRAAGEALNEPRLA